MNLQNLRAKTSAAKNGDKAATTFAALFQVATAVEAEGGLLRLTGHVINDVPEIGGPDVPVVVEFRGDDAGRALSSFIKGQAWRKMSDDPVAAAGTILTLESSYVVKGEPGPDGQVTISSRWLNTLAVPGEAEHANRGSLEGVYSSGPKIQFKNPDFRDGVEEPQTITVALAAATFTGRVATGSGTFSHTFDRAWGLEKLARLPVGVKPSVFLDVLEPANAQRITDEASLRAALSAQLARGTRAMSVLRVADDSEVLVRTVYGSYKRDQAGAYHPDPDTAVKTALENNLFRGIDNETLFSALASGSVTIEAIPGYQVNYAGDPTKDNNAAFKLVKDAIEGKTLRYEIMFGKEPNTFASVLLPGIKHTDGIDGFSAINVLADRPGRKPAAGLATAHINPATLASTPAASDDANEEPEPQSPGGP